MRNLEPVKRKVLQPNIDPSVWDTIAAPARGLAYNLIWVYVAEQIARRVTGHTLAQTQEELT